MICIATRDTELAKKLELSIEGRKALILDCTPPRTNDEDEADEKRMRRPRTYCGTPLEQDRQRAQDYFRHQVHSLQPGVIILDVRFGLNDFLALEQVPQLRAVRSGPAVVLVAPDVPVELKREALRVGCFDVISTKRRACVKEVASAVSEAWQARRTGMLSPPEPLLPDGATVH